MFNLVSLLVAAALVSLQCSLETTARQIDNKKIDLDNSLHPNAVSAPKRRLRLFVRMDPLPQTVRHLPGTTTILDCQVTGYPAPSVAWMKNGELISDFEEESNEVVRVSPITIAHLISKLVLTAPSDGDVYTCVATAGPNRKTSSTTVLVAEGEDTADALEQLFNLPAGPIITEFYDNVLQESGSSVVLPCRVSSFTKAQVYWEDNYDTLIENSPRAKVLPSGDLLIPKLNWNDMGVYTCVAKNMYGVDSVTTFLYPMKSSNPN